MNDVEIRVRALELALLHGSGFTTDEIMQMARVYYAFLKEGGL